MPKATTVATFLLTIYCLNWAQTHRLCVNGKTRKQTWAINKQLIRIIACFTNCRSLFGIQSVVEDGWKKKQSVWHHLQVKIVINCQRKLRGATRKTSQGAGKTSHLSTIWQVGKSFEFYLHTYISNVYICITYIDICIFVYAYMYSYTYIHRLRDSLIYGRAVRQINNATFSFVGSDFLLVCK